MSRNDLPLGLTFCLLVFSVFSSTFSLGQETSPSASSDRSELWCEYPGGEGPGSGKRIVLIAGDDEYRSEETMPMLGKILSQHHGFAVTVLFPVNEETELIQPSHQTNIPGMQRIDGADLVILGLRFRNLPDEQMQHFVDYHESGKPIIGFRTATHSFNYPDDSTSKFKHYGWNSKEWTGGFGQQVLGDTWISHHGNHKSESTRGVIADGKQEHPILRGVADVWGDSDVYGIKNLKDSADVLMLGQVLAGMQPTDQPVDGRKNDPMMPILWTQEVPSKSGKIARIVCTTMGAATDFENEDLRRALINSCYWCLKMEDQIPAKNNVEIVGEFKPTNYGFGTEQQNLRPADFKMAK